MTPEEEAINEIKIRLATIEKTIENIEARLRSIEGYMKWTLLTIGGAIILAAVNFMIMGGLSP